MSLQTAQEPFAPKPQKQLVTTLLAPIHVFVQTNLRIYACASFA